MVWLCLILLWLYYQFLLINAAYLHILLKTASLALGQLKQLLSRYQRSEFERYGDNYLISKNQQKNQQSLIRISGIQLNLYRILTS